MGCCPDCGDCCSICGDVSSGAAFRSCEHRDFGDHRDSEGLRLCGVCGGEGEHNFEVHNAELRSASYY